MENTTKSSWKMELGESVQLSVEGSVSAAIYAVRISTAYKPDEIIMENGITKISVIVRIESYYVREKEYMSLKSALHLYL